LFVLVLLLLVGIGGANQPTAAQVSSPRVARRSFYLTDLNHDADAVLSVCAEGYHAAALWEILEMSGLTYAYDHPDAHTKSDSGQGPPSNWYGWVRTGGASSGVDTAGIGNCRAWTSTDAADRGAIVRLSSDWTSASTALSPWEARTFTCGGLAPVWCVEAVVNLSQTMLPLVLRQ
jgi:hypothetical protein